MSVGCVLEQLLHDRDGYATNKAAISEELTEQQRRCEEISKFGADHSLSVSCYATLGDIRLDESGFGECISDARLQNYTISPSLLCIRIRIPKSNIPLDRFVGHCVVPHCSYRNRQIMTDFYQIYQIQGTFHIRNLFRNSSLRSFFESLCIEK